MGWVGGAGGSGVVFTNLIFFVGWVAMVLTSSSCNLGIDNFDGRLVPNLFFYSQAAYFH